MKKRIRYTIRTLLAFIGLLALALAHLANQASLERKTLQHIANGNGRVFYRRHDLEQDEVAIAGIQGEVYDQDPPGSELIHRLFGRTFTCRGTQIYLPGKVDEKTLRTVCLLPKLRRIDLTDAIVDRTLVNELESEYPFVDFVVP